MKQSDLDEFDQRRRAARTPIPEDGPKAPIDLTKEAILFQANRRKLGGGELSMQKSREKARLESPKKKEKVSPPKPDLNNRWLMNQEESNVE